MTLDKVGIAKVGILGAISTGILGIGLGICLSKTSLEGQIVLDKYDGIAREATVNPRDLTFKFNPVDNTNTNVLQAIYRGKNYILTLDKEGRPQFQQYRVEPAKLILEATK